MGAWGPLHWLVVLAVVLLLFGGRGKISSLMGDFGKGLSAFKKGVGLQEEPPPSQAGQPGDTAKPISAQTTTTPPPAGQVRQDTAAKV